MVGAVHNEGNPLGNGAKVPDYQPVTNEFIEMCDVFLKPVGSVDVIVISIGNFYKLNIYISEK